MFYSFRLGGSVMPWREGRSVKQMGMERGGGEEAESCAAWKVES